ncbi:MDR family oxidoreductase [Halomonas daqiaonensis]|uniref:Putative quinone oxidoreductase, YhdH/YhfP family n=1 Tax=Halomonas daqiaonensis TaxID=650850 RepID=A0A1H7KPJ1_9GAMM|nr:MDR family oxidoreductase [Halomonas daqiaonensis]SEK88436.1 putative quinone oxidoreductase, YhdH/YhfP family [Halomonas daqiaonensis]
MFKAILIDKQDEGQRVALETLDESRLPEGDVTVRVECSTLNYKDALAITGKGPVVRSFPMVPGIDLAGTVESSTAEAYQPGDSVLLNGWGVGETHWGGLAEKARLDSRWLIPHPTAFSARQSMAIGTAGYTAMLAVIALERQGITPDRGEVLVTGANGGVGSYAIALLSRLGYWVVASTGRLEETAYLESLGAQEVIDRQTLSEPGRPLAKERWAAAIDSVGSHTLANVLAGTRYDGTVVACGLAQGMDLPGSVAPFILRGVTLSGIDSVMRSYADRVEAWQRLGELLASEQLEAIMDTIGLDEAIDKAGELLAGRVRGRVVVDMAG